jgi:phosphopentomutase
MYCPTKSPQTLRGENLTHANLCRPLHYFVIAHTSTQLNLTDEQIKDLMKSLEEDGFKTIAADRTGLISTLNIVKECNIPGQIKQMATPYLFPTNLEVSISRDGLILILLNAWYPLFDIPYGTSRNVEQIKPAIEYLEKKISHIINEQISVKIIRGTKRCLFEHPGAYTGYF